MTNKFENPADALTFMTAGKCTVTLKSLRTDTHFTFKINAPKDNDTVLFVKVLTGSDNSWNGDWSFIGTIFISTDGLSFRAGRKGCPDAPSFKAMTFTLNCLRADMIPNMLEIWHEGQCGMCGKPLTHPTSIASGLGPICAGKV